jgi:hypothetical protein
MCWAAFEPYLIDLGIAVGGGLVSTGVYLAYQYWRDEYSRWPFSAGVAATPDPLILNNFTGRVWIRNPTRSTAQFDISFLLADGERGWPLLCYPSDAPTEKITGLASVRPGEKREFEVYPASYGSAILGISLLVYGPYRRRGREKLLPFDHAFDPMKPT